MRKLTLALAAAAAFSISAPAHAATELVTNGGFEAGGVFEDGGFYPPNWARFGPGGPGAVSNLAVDVHSGSWGFTSGPVGTTAGIEQVLTTVAGQTYTITFWLTLEGLTPQASTPSTFDASFDGFSLLSLANEAPFGFTQFSFTATASTTSTPLRFTFRDDPGFWAIDDISVQEAIAAVPEPATWMMMLLGFGAIGASMRFRRRRNESAHVQ